jgi:hypothetical protein
MALSATTREARLAVLLGVTSCRLAACSTLFSMQQQCLPQLNNLAKVSRQLGDVSQQPWGSQRLLSDSWSANTRGRLTACMPYGTSGAQALQLHSPVVA